MTAKVRDPNLSNNNMKTHGSTNLLRCKMICSKCVLHISSGRRITWPPRLLVMAIIHIRNMNMFICGFHRWNKHNFGELTHKSIVDV